MCFVNKDRELFMAKHTAASVRACVAGAAPVDLHGCTGITTYIRQVLMRGVAFERPRVVGDKPPLTGRVRVRRRVCAQKLGLVLGRRLDSKFSAFVNRGEPHALLNGVRHRLRSCRVGACMAQVKVGVPSLGLRTELDGIGVDEGGGVWVLELKNTQSTVAAHKRVYEQPCRKNAVLSNGRTNSELVRHKLQVGFGMLGLRECYGFGGVRGLVIVNCADGCVAYTVDSSEYAVRSLFARPGRVRGA
jgi:hypothetical protein